ncbi:hypothetical protein N1030_14365 [Desulfovibrio mangrovi]|uniref:hypothetical protein n=1 Tax=Desulfovibrio mangrovi TaxID=2976983 RepID=UPI00224640CF|nr:hypothetical protein [Desulfovibrio mangrovi]UZP66783.1 hypothetical protein N1030_14365 [Desulfovibrio mangrovi]
MKKKLVEKDGIDACICKATGKVYADGSIILTAGAKDELSKRGITIVYGPKPETAACPPGCTCEACTAKAHACPPDCTCPACTAAAEADLERLMLGVAAMLKTEYGVEDLEQLQAISWQVAKTIRENI